MEVRDSPCRSFHFPGNDARKSLADAKLAWEKGGLGSQQRRQKKSLCCPENGDGWVTPRGRYDEHSRKFSLDMIPRFNRPVGGG